MKSFTCRSWTFSRRTMAVDSVLEKASSERHGRRDKERKGKERVDHGLLYLFSQAWCTASCGCSKLQSLLMLFAMALFCRLLNLMKARVLSTITRMVRLRSRLSQALRSIREGPCSTLLNNQEPAKSIPAYESWLVRAAPLASIVPSTNY